jgi:tyrosyl-tRNA synthetase
MAKSIGNYIGVTDPPAEMYGKTLSIPDSSLGDWYSLLLDSEPSPEQGPRDAKRALARTLVARFHGPAAAEQAEGAFDRQFIAREVPDDVPEVSFGAGQGLVHLPALLKEAFGVSTSEARRQIAQGGVRLDGEPVADGSLDLAADQVDGKVVQLGKRRFARVRLS